MNAQGLSVTVVGWVATPPKEIHGTGVPYTSFRLATTPRRFDSRAGGWTDGRTEWITVKAFREVAHNVAESVRKGEPMIVQGRLQTEEWQGENGPRTSLVLEAAALGHDLARGRTRFARIVRTGTGTGTGADGQGVAEADADGRTERTSGGPAPVPDTEDPWAHDGVPSSEDVDAPQRDEDVMGGAPADVLAPDEAADAGVRTS